MAKAKYATDKDKNKVYMISHTKAIYDSNGQVLEDRLQGMATESSDYTDAKIAALINGAPETLDTLKEVADAIENNETVVDALNSAIGTKANKTDVDTALSDKLDVNGDASDTTVAFTQASTRVNIANGEKQSTLFSKIAKWFADLKTVAFSGSYNDLSDKPTIPSKTSDLTNDSGFKTTDSNTTYSLSKSGSTITLTGSDGSTTSVTDSDTNTTYGVVSTSANGLMSTSDKTKLDGIETGANKTTVDTVLSSTSTNPVQNKVVNTALSGKQATITGGASTITSSNLTSNRALVSNSSGKVGNSTVTSTELGYLSGATSNIQSQINNRVLYSDYFDGFSFLSCITETGNLEFEFSETINFSNGLSINGDNVTDYVLNSFNSNGYISIDEVTQAILDLQNTVSPDLTSYMQKTGGTFTGAVTHNANIAMGNTYKIYSSSYTSFYAMYLNGSTYNYGYNSTSSSYTNNFGYQSSTGGITNNFGYRNYSSSSGKTTNYFGRNYASTSLNTTSYMENYYGYYAGANYFGYNARANYLGNSTSYPLYMQGSSYKVVGTTTGYNTKIHVSSSEPTMSTGDLWFKIPA